MVGVSSSNWIRPVVLAVSCLILGFVGGWALASVGDDELALPDARVDVTVVDPAPKTTTVAPPAPAEPPARDKVVVSVMNGTTRAGLAASTARTLRGLGYSTVSIGTATARPGPTVVFYREGSRPAAEQLAKDLQVATVTALDGTPYAQSTAAGTQLVVLLGV